MRGKGDVRDVVKVNDVKVVAVGDDGGRPALVQHQALGMLDAERAAIVQEQVEGLEAPLVQHILNVDRFHGRKLLALRGIVNRPAFRPIRFSSLPNAARPCQRENRCSCGRDRQVLGWRSSSGRRRSARISPGQTPARQRRPA